MVADSIASGAVSEEDNVVERALDGELKTEETERFRILVLTLTLFECNLEGATFSDFKHAGRVSRSAMIDCWKEMQVFFVWNFL